MIKSISVVCYIFYPDDWAAGLQIIFDLDDNRVHPKPQHVVVKPHIYTIYPRPFSR